MAGLLRDLGAKVGKSPENVEFRQDRVAFSITGSNLNLGMVPKMGIKSVSFDAASRGVIYT